MNWLLFLVAFAVGLDEFLLGPLLTPIGTEFSVPPERVALMVAAYNLPLALLAPLIGAISDQIGRLRVMGPALAGFAGASMLTAVAPTFALALGARVLTGIAAAGMLPVAFALASEAEDGARAISRVQAGLTLGIILGPLNGALTDAAGNWRMSFCVLATIAALLFLSVRHMAETEKAGAPKAQDHLASVRFALPGLAAMLLGLGGAIGIFAILGERVRDIFGFETWQVSALFAVFGLTTVGGNLLAPQMIGRFGARLAASLNLVVVLAGIVVVFAPSRPGFALVALGLVAWSVFGGAAAPALQATLAQVSERHRGFILALGSSALNLGVALSSALAAGLHLRETHFVALQAIAMILPVAILVAVWGMRKTFPNPSSEHMG